MVGPERRAIINVAQTANVLHNKGVNAAAAFLVSIAQLAQTSGLVSLACDNTGYQIEIEASGDAFSLVVCTWSDRDTILHDGPSDDVFAAIAALAPDLEALDVVVEELRVS